MWLCLFVSIVTQMNTFWEEGVDICVSLCSLQQVRQASSLQCTEEDFS